MPKIRMFLWRVVSGAIAVADRLNSRGLNVSSTCQLCKSDQETINHVLFLCDTASDMWRIASIPLPSAGFSASLEENLSFLFDLLDTHTMDTYSVKSIPSILWSIWKNQNAILFASSQESPMRIVQLAGEETQLWFEVNKKATVSDAQGGSNETR